MGVKRVLQCFQILSGFKINFKKSSLYAFGNSKCHVSRWVELLGCTADHGPINYLGAVLGANPSSVRFWDPLLLKFSNKINSFEADKISLAGKSILLRAAIDSVPLYWFSLYKVPVTVANKLEQMRRAFLWGNKENGGNKLHLISWDKVCSPKELGGLGLSLISIRNLASLAKWVWKAYSERGSMWNEVLTRRYGKVWNYDISRLDPKVCSPIVRHIVNLSSDPRIGRLLSRENFKWCVRNGSLAYFWEDWWIGDIPLCSLLPSLYNKVRVKHMVVKDFILLWKRGNLNDIWVDTLNSELLDELPVLSGLLEQFSLTVGVDALVWLPGNNLFTTNLCRNLLSNFSSSIHHSYIWRVIWKIKAPPKILAFLWKIQWNILPTRVFISLRIVGVPNFCPWCGRRQESISHLFWECTLAIWGWNYIGKWWNVPGIVRRSGSFSLVGLLKISSSPLGKEIWKIVVAAVLWSIWLARNELVFNNKRISESCFIKLINLRVNKWGSVSGFLTFGADPLWSVNPQGAIALRHHNILRSFWGFKRDQFDLVGAVDGAWGKIDEFKYNGGIGGFLQDSTGKMILMFSGPASSKSALETEVDAILHLIKWMIKLKMDLKRTVICSDSSSAVNSFNEGLSVKFPLKAMDFDQLHVINTTFFIHFVPRYLNEQADELAKKGIFRPHLVEKLVR